MIHSVRIKRFRSINDAGLRLGGLTLVVGANASGKSNLLEALQILAWMSRGQRLGDLQSAMRDGQLAVRGSVSSFLPFGEGGPAVEFEVELDGPPSVGRLRLSLQLRIDGGEVSVERELLEAPEHDRAKLPLYWTVGEHDRPAHRLQVSYNNFKRGGKKPTIDCVDDRPVFTQLVSPARFDRQHDEAQATIPAAAEATRAALGGVLFLDPDPRAMRDYAFRDEHQLRGNGANLSAVLWNLCRVADTYETLLAAVRAVPDQAVSAIGFVETPRNEVMVKIAERLGGTDRWVEAALLSDGTLRVLAIAGALLSVPPATLLVIEEIDNGVHPSRAKHLLDLIVEIARRRQLRVIITTHNPALQDHLPAQALEDVHIAYRDAESSATRVCRLGDLPRFAELALSGPLGQLITRRSLERYLPDHAEHRAPAPIDFSFLSAESDSADA